MTKEFNSSIQEVIRNFREWLEKNQHHFQNELEKANYLFWSDRDDVAPIEINKDTEMFFNEWMMLDFSVPGYDKIPVKKRYNFLDCFLKKEGKNLSAAGKIFAKNASVSNFGFYKVLNVNKGKNTKLKDLFSSKEIVVWDVNLSNAAIKGVIVYGRYSKDEKNKYIGSGSHGGFLSEALFQIAKLLITETHKMVCEEGAEITMAEFLKWNSYIYYREIMNMQARLSENETNHALKKSSKNESDDMWGGEGPYSEVNLIEQTRILDEGISRMFLEVEARINPFTFEYVLKHRKKFANDQAIQQLLDHAEYRGADGYVVFAGEEEFINEKSLEIASSYRQMAIENVLKMHNFVIDELKIKVKKRGELKIKDSDSGSNDSNEKYVWDENLGIVKVDDMWKAASNIDSPAGVKHGKIRYYAVFVIASGKTFNEEETRLFAKCVKKNALKFDVEIENVSAGMNYVMATLLICPNMAPADMIEASIAQVNNKGELLAKDYIITNIARPTGKEIESFIKSLS